MPIKIATLRNKTTQAPPTRDRPAREAPVLLRTGEQAFRADAALEHQPRPGAQLFGLALQLAAGGEDVASARRADGRGVARVEDDFGEGFDALPARQTLEDHGVKFVD